MLYDSLYIINDYTRNITKFVNGDIEREEMIKYLNDPGFSNLTYIFNLMNETHDGGCDILDESYNRMMHEFYSEWGGMALWSYRDRYMQVHGLMHIMGLRAINIMSFKEALENDCQWNAT